MALLFNSRFDDWLSEIRRDGDTSYPRTAGCYPSPDGRVVAATSWDTGDLILRDVDSGKVRRLTHKPTTWAREPGGVYGAVFSPDGRRIAYQWATSRTSGELRVIGVDGTGERSLYRDPTVVPMDWSPDGSRILASLRLEVNGDERMALISVADGSVQLVSTPQGTRFRNVLFAADGNGLVFSVPNNQNSGSEIHRLPFTGAQSTLIASTGNSNSVIGWSPDRRRLIFSSDRRGRTGIWAISVSDRGVEGEPQELMPDAND